MTTQCPCMTEDVSRWPFKRPSEWTEAERTHVRLLTHGGVEIRHSHAEFQEDEVSQ